METKSVSIPELIRVAKENQSTQSQKAIDENFDEITQFILIFKLKDGMNKISRDIVYQAYCAWSLTPLSQKTFNLRFHRVFKRQGLHYYLNHKPGQLLNLAQQKKANK